MSGRGRFRDAEEFGPTIDAAAEQLDISPTAVEKDYWVLQVLRALVRDFHDDFVFKGGTSLSKAYGILERFSEDIDVLVLPGGRGRGAVDKLMKAMGTAAAASVGGEPSGAGAETGRHRAYRLDYPATRKATRLITTSVLLEMGVRGGSHPQQSMPIGSLLGDVLSDAGTNIEDFEDLAAFNVRVLHPGRTLLEKLDHIHGLAQRLQADRELEPPARSGRHFYDVYQLLGDEHVLKMLRRRDEVDAVVVDIEETSGRFFGRASDSSGRPTEGYAASPAFDPANQVSERLRQAYEATMPDLHFGHDDLPGWDQVCHRVSAPAKSL